MSSDSNRLTTKFMEELQTTTKSLRKLVDEYLERAWLDGYDYARDKDVEEAEAKEESCIL